MRAGFVSAVLFQHLRFLKDNDYFVYRLLDNGNSTLWTIGWEGHDEGDTSGMNADTSALSGSGKFTKITTAESAVYLGMGESEMTPESCSKLYKEVWDETHKPDAINATMITQANNKELMPHGMLQQLKIVSLQMLVMVMVMVMV